jgi:CheY-like chemotaxis protein
VNLETILLVDNDAAIRRVVRAVLQQLGYRVLEAGSDAEAADTLSTAEVPIDLLVTDIGTESAEYLTNLRPEMKVLCLSGSPDDLAPRGALREPYHIISKPLKPYTLARTVRQVLDEQHGVKAVKRPLQRQFKGLDPDHPFFANQGITIETARHFGAGFFPGPGPMHGRIVIPIHDDEGELIAYAGHVVDGSDAKCRYWPEFNKSQVLFNLKPARCMVTELALSVIVVEDFLHCMKVHQAGYPSVVSLTGSSLSDEQEQLLADNFYLIALFLGRREMSTRIATRLMKKCFVKQIADPAGRSPADLSVDEIGRLVSDGAAPERVTESKPATLRGT